MTMPRCLAGALALLLGLACTSDDTPAETETGTDTQAATETAGDGDGDGDGCNTAVGVYGDCVNGGLDACMTDQPLCLDDNPEMPSVGVCRKRCEDACDCWAAPDSGDAPVACKALVAGDDDRTCVLDCSNGEACPDSMSCLESLGICVFSVD